MRGPDQEEQMHQIAFVCKLQQFRCLMNIMLPPIPRLIQEGTKKLQLKQLLVDLHVLQKQNIEITVITTAYLWCAFECHCCSSLS